MDSVLQWPGFLDCLLERAMWLFFGSVYAWWLITLTGVLEFVEPFYLDFSLFGCLILRALLLNLFFGGRFRGTRWVMSDKCVFSLLDSLLQWPGFLECLFGDSSWLALFFLFVSLYNVHCSFCICVWKSCCCPFFFPTSVEFIVHTYWLVVWAVAHYLYLCK